jgi:hypothetical protein
MPVAPSFDDLLAQFEAEASARRPSLQFLEGDVATALAHGSGAMADACIRFTAQSFRDTFIDGAKGDALTALVDDRYNLQRDGATKAQATVIFARTGGGVGGTIAAGFVVGSQFDAAGNTVLYVLDADVTFTGGDNGPHDGTITAQTTGREGNVAAGLISRVVDTPFDPLITVTNPAAAAGGNDEEGDDDLRVRARNFWQTLRKGTLQALEFGARQVESVRTARASEDPVTGIVTIVVGDADGNSSAQMISDVIAELEAWRAAASIVNVVGGASLMTNVIGMLVVKSGVDASVLAPLAAAAISGRMTKLRQGETMYLDSIKAAAISVDPDAIEALVLTSPAADVVPSSAQVVRPGTVTIS